MKKPVKFCLSIAGTLLAVGVVCMVAGAVMGGRGETDRYFEENWRSAPWAHVLTRGEGIHIGGENGIHVDDTGVDIGGEHGLHLEHYGSGSGAAQNIESGALSGVSSIEVDVDCADVRIQEGESCSVSLSWELSNYSMAWEMTDGRLAVTSDSWPGITSGGFGNNCKAVITLPAGTALDTLEISTDLGDIEITGDITVRKADLSTDLGDVTCQGLQAGELEAETDLGDVELHVPGPQKDYNWELETNMGELYLDGEKRSGGLGTIAEQGGSGENSLDASSALGNVQVDFEG